MKSAPSDLEGFKRKEQETKAAAFLSLLTFEMALNPLGDVHTYRYDDQLTAMVECQRKRVMKAEDATRAFIMAQIFNECTSVGEM